MAENKKIDKIAKTERVPEEVLQRGKPDKRNVILSVKDLEVKFRVRGRVLTAIRGISLDIHEGESIAIVGESGSGKSVFTKTFAGMLDDNGFIDNGSLIFNDPTLSDTHVPYLEEQRKMVQNNLKALNEYSKYEFGAKEFVRIEQLEEELKSERGLSTEEEENFAARKKDLEYQRTEIFNLKQTIDPSKERERYKETQAQLKDYDNKLKELEQEKKVLIAKHKADAEGDKAYVEKCQKELAELKETYAKKISAPLTKEQQERNLLISKEIHLSVGRFDRRKRHKAAVAIIKELGEAMKRGVDLSSETNLNDLFGKVTFRVKYLDETETQLHGTCIIDLAKVKYPKDWTQIRGCRIATVFQDPMTSLNPIITIGKQITSVILKHQDCSESEARRRALDLMNKVGIPNADKRFDDYPFQYSGGMRQRIVIAIALSCQPKILICDEPTTALDVTIQAQILDLIKGLQKEFGYTIVFITHDLGVVANIAERVAVLYAGQIVEVGTVEEVFQDPRHPYTWALLSSLPQLAERNTQLFSISGTPPSLYNKIVGDPFAPRNQYCLKIDTLKEPPMFKVTDTHYAKTWLLDPRAPKVDKPEIIHDIHNKLINAFNI